MQPEIKTLLRKLLAQKEARIHLMGVSGSGMSGLARLLLQSGHRVSGSDLNRSATIEKLQAQGLQFFQGHSSENVKGADLVVFSSAISAANPERAAAESQGIPSVRRAECLAILAEPKEILLVAGMHGKTTTASMLAHVLRSSDWRCAHYIGAEVPILGSSANWGEGHHFVIEGDESDGSLTSFIPRHSLILNIEEEHLDYYRGMDEILRVFAQVIDQTSGHIIYCADDKNTLLLCSHNERAIGYGFSEVAHYQGRQVRLDSFASYFQVCRQGQVLGTVTLNIPGLQNVSNALGVIAIAMEIGVPWEKIVRALAEFRGASRRFEVKFKSTDFMVVDDYAHHPTEIKATLAAAKNSGWKRILALFQPHRYSRTKMLLDEFAEAFSDADELFLTDIYAASETPLEGVTGQSLADAVVRSGHLSVQYEPSLSRLRSMVSRSVRPGDLIITLGAGNIHEVASKLARELTWFEQLRAQLQPGSVLLRQEPMSKHTSMRIGGPAQFWCEPVDERDLAAALRWAAEHQIPVTLIGRGTNLLVRDGGIPGLCVHLGQPHFCEVRVNGEKIEAGAGVRLKNLVAEAKKAGLGGLEFMEGIPGNLGGALRMNAGAMQGWTMEVIEQVRTMDLQGQVHVYERSEIEVHYRSVPLLEREIALGAILRGTPGSMERINEKLRSFSSKRWDSQPAAPSAGCIFKNTEVSPAGKLIDELGLKNLSVGHARVSDVHANFIVNEGGATARDVLDLIGLIQKKAKEARGVDLQTEVIVLGENA